MACAIAITSVTGVGGSPPTSILVTGTANVAECTAINVTLQCNSGATASLVVPVDASGNWTADFTAIANLVCICTKGFIVQASCAAGTCTPATLKGALECPPQPGCPTATVTITDLGCLVGDGTRTIQLNAAITGPGTIVTQWDFDGSILGPAVVGLSNVQNHAYATPGPWTATLNVILPAGCPPAAVVTVGPLAACPSACPDAEVTVNIVGCVGGGASAVATFNVTLTPPTSGCTYFWNFGDSGTAITTVPAASHTYTTAGTFAVSVAVVCGATCVSSAGVIAEVPDCCPQLVSVAGTISGCVDDSNVATVTWVATTNPSGAPGSYFWSYDDGMTATTPAPTHTRTYNTAGPHTVDVTYTSGLPFCPPQLVSGSVNVPACGGNGGGSTACGLPTLIIAILGAAILGAVIIGLVVTVCLGLPLPSWYWTVVAISAGVLALIIGLAYLLCAIGWCPCPTECDWLRIAWIVAVAGAVIALYLAGCCGAWWWALTIGLFLAAGLALKKWRDNCNPSTCEVVLTLVVALATVAGTLFGFIALLGPLTAVITACAWLWVKVAAAALAGILAGWASLNCTSGP